MADKTGIEWTDATWNPVTGCTKVSPGCANCYITSTPPFRIAGRTWDRSGSTGLVFHPERLDQPKRWTRPRMIFVNSLSDMFHEEIPPSFIAEVFATMRDSPQHIFQVLTKRPERMREVMSMTPLVFLAGLPNVWLGTTIENARNAYRADILREIPAAIRFISAEPLIGPLWTAKHSLDLTDIDWVISGGESGGSHVRPMKIEWVRELRDACIATGTAHFLKQVGSFDFDGRYNGRSGKSSGKVLDGREWCEYPGTLPQAA